jgi:DNA-binding NarL/FixJ family response regulator
MSNPPKGLSLRRLRARGVELAVLSFPLPSGEALTTAEVALLRELIGGRSNKQIAADRATSVRTVANQVAALLKKCGAESRADLAARWPELLATNR